MNKRGTNKISSILIDCTAFIKFDLINIVTFYHFQIVVDSKREPRRIRAKERLRRLSSAQGQEQHQGSDNLAAKEKWPNLG